MKPLLSKQGVHSMKTLTLIIALASSFAFANPAPILLDQVEMVMDSSSLHLEKGAYTPSTVNLIVPVTKSENVCVRYDERRTYGTNGAECGYRTVTRRIPVHTHGGGRTVVVRRGSRTGTTVHTRPTPVRRYRVVTERVPRACNYYESYCADYDVETTTYDKKYTINFLKFGAKAAEFTLYVNPNSSEINMITPGASCVKIKKYENGADIKLKRRCR
jgi:hypothetical protein